MSGAPRSSRDQALVLLAVGVAGVALIVVLASVAYLLLEPDEPSPRPAAPVAAAPGPATTDPAAGAGPEAGDDDAREPGRRRTPTWGTFETGTDPGESVPATVCRMRSREVYCWTPNDGYTIVLGRDGLPQRLRGDEQRNRGRTVAGARLLAPGRTARRGAFRCTAEPVGLVCESPAGHGWVLPRYRGLPDLY